MGLNAKKQSTGTTGGIGKQGNIEPDTYNARVVQLIDLGVQKQRPFRGEPKDPAQMLYITYELVDCFCKDEDGNDIPDKPRWISEDFPFFSLNADRAKSTKRYNAIDPSGVLDGEFTDLVDQPCDVIVVSNLGKGKHEGKIFDNIADVVPMRKKDVQSCPPLQNPAKVFVFDEPDLDVFQSLPEWLQERIKGSEGYPTSELRNLLEGSSEAPEAPVEDEETEDNPY